MRNASSFLLDSDTEIAPRRFAQIHIWGRVVFQNVNRFALELERSSRRGLLAVARAVGALLVLAAGAIHLWLYFDYFHGVHGIGVLFLVNAAAAVVVAAALLASDHP